MEYSYKPVLHHWFSRHCRLALCTVSLVGRAVSLLNTTTPTPPPHCWFGQDTPHFTTAHRHLLSSSNGCMYLTCYKAGLKTTLHTLRHSAAPALPPSAPAGWSSPQARASLTHLLACLFASWRPACNSSTSTHWTIAGRWCIFWVWTGGLCDPFTFPPTSPPTHLKSAAAYCCYPLTVFITACRCAGATTTCQTHNAVSATGLIFCATGMCVTTRRLLPFCCGRLAERQQHVVARLIRHTRCTNGDAATAATLYICRVLPAALSGRQPS